MKCCMCKREILPGNHVYPGSFDVWHTTCDSGACYAVMGSDGKLRWAGGNCVEGSIGREVANHDRYE